MSGILSLWELPIIRNLGDADRVMQQIEDQASTIQHAFYKQMRNKRNDRNMINSLFDQFISKCNNMARAVTRTTAYNEEDIMMRNKVLVPSKQKADSIKVYEMWLQMRNQAQQSRKGLIKMKEVIMDMEKVY